MGGMRTIPKENRPEILPPRSSPHPVTLPEALAAPVGLRVTFSTARYEPPVKPSQKVTGEGIVETLEKVTLRIEVKQFGVLVLFHWWTCWRGGRSSRVFDRSRRRA